MWSCCQRGTTGQAPGSAHSPCPSDVSLSCCSPTDHTRGPGDKGQKGTPIHSRRGSCEPHLRFWGFWPFGASGFLGFPILKLPLPTSCPLNMRAMAGLTTQGEGTAGLGPGIFKGVKVPAQLEEGV